MIEPLQVLITYINENGGIHHAKWIGTKVGTAGNVYVTRMITREI
jgi:hypothetical protein